MTCFCQLIQCIKNTTAQTDKFAFVNPHLLCNGIRCLKSNSPDVICKPVWVLLYDCNALTSIRLENLCRMRGADLMTLQKKHDILDLFLLLPACFDPVYTYFSYT